MAKGFKIADFFAEIGIKADTNEVKKIENSLNKIKKALQLINQTGTETKKKIDKAFDGEALRRQQLLIKGSYASLRKLGGSIDDFNGKLSKTNTASGFLKLRNDIKEAELAIKKLNSEPSRKPSQRSSPKSNTIDPVEAYIAQKSTQRLLHQLPDKLTGNTTLTKGKFLELIKLQSQALAGNRKEANAAKVAMEELARANIRAMQAEGRHNKVLNSQQKALRRVAASTNQLILSFTGAFAAFDAVRSINQIGQDFEGMRAAMLASSGSSIQAGNDLKFIRQEAHRLGLDLKNSTDAFIKLQFAAKGKMTNQQTRELFTGFSEFATALQVAPEQQKAGLRALQQINIQCLPI